MVVPADPCGVYPLLPFVDTSISFPENAGKEELKMKTVEFKNGEKLVLRLAGDRLHWRSD